MDRRKFLQTLSIMSATTTLSGYACSVKATVDTAMPTPGSKAPPKGAFDSKRLPKIGVVAIGRTASELLTRLSGKLPYIESSIAIDDDQEALLNIAADRKIFLGERETDARLQIAEAVSGLDISFVVADVCDPIGTPFFPIVADIMREEHVMSIGVPIKPCDVEGTFGHKSAIACANTFTAKTDAVFPIEGALPSGTLLCPATMTFERLYKGITTPFAAPGLVNIDFEDIKLLLTCSGNSSIGYGSAYGSNAAQIAAIQAIAHPLFGTGCLCDVSVILVSIEGRSGLIKLREVSKIMNTIRDVAPESLLIFGATENENMYDDFRVTIMTSGWLPEA